MDYKKNIFTLEGEWNENPEDKSSVIDMLRFLKNIFGIDYFHRRVATKEEFFYHLENTSNDKYDIIYLPFHGSKGLLSLENDEITLEELKDYKSFFKGKIIHFSSCQTLNYYKPKLEKLKKDLNAKNISGYKTDVDWVDSMLLDIAYFTWWQQYKTRGTDLHETLKDNYTTLYNRLGFVMV